MGLLILGAPPSSIHFHHHHHHHHFQYSFLVIFNPHSDPFRNHSHSTMSFSDIQLHNRLKLCIANLRNLLDTFPNPDPHLLSIITYRQKEINTIISVLQQSVVFHTSTINQPSTPPPPTLYTTLSSSPTFNQVTLPASQLL